jgi:hypothetical protein
MRENRRPQTAALSPLGDWFSRFTATLAAVLVGGALLGLGLRFYIHESIRDTSAQIKERLDGKK